MDEELQTKPDPLVIAARNMLGDFAPKLLELTEDVLLGDVWNRPQLSPRDRSSISCTVLIVLGKTDLMKVHFPRAIENGVTQEEIVELITHLAFHAGWPQAITAMMTQGPVRACAPLRPALAGVKPRGTPLHAPRARARARLSPPPRSRAASPCLG
ncbi:uncharacterized protein CMC5_043480 [Chondromyces crocatus]|uniref:Carboxymuconolactone decarboxylase-like domain-containing protein n=2 Tax=Chondromyces crocatus TaxID=52 RepID=A0A0K1EH59_CHOCO|nr:uncharacterized protein CMC5_043480 [Chondromyces crocatus]